MVCDPSMTGFGFTVLNQQGQIIEAECIKTSPENKKRRIRKGDDRVRRLNEINNIVLPALKKYNVSLILTEQPHGSQNASAAVMIGIVIGMLQTISDCFNIPIEWYSEGDSKYTLLGKRSATKKETIDKIKKLYSVPWTGIGYRDEAIADSMSIYHLALKTSATLNLLLKMKK